MSGAASDLELRLLRRIAAQGPMTVAEFMASALYDPAGGYYTTGRPIGAAGDFVTAPEVSQLFGELVGLWCADTWDRLGRPAPVRLIELGPGRGTLLADLLRAARVLPAFEQALEIHLVEVSRELRERQEAVLQGRAATWHDRLETVPEGAFLLIANEFLDALPLRQFERAPDAWRERLVGDLGGRLGFALSGPLPFGLIPEALRPAPVGSVIEISPAADAVLRELGRRATAAPGAGLVIDYGYRAPPLRGTLQAVAGHRSVPPLQAPGQVDLSGLVDFGAAAASLRAGGAQAWGPVGQGALLRELGIDLRAERLSRADPGQAARLAAAVHRLTDPAEMGERFLALAFGSPGLAAPAGFAALP